MTADKIRREVDRLIDYHATPGTRPAPERIKVRALAKELTFCAVTPQGDYVYRGHVLEPTKVGRTDRAAAT